MRKLCTGALVIVLSMTACRVATALDTNFASDGYISQITMDAFNQSVRHRMQIARFAFYGGVNAPPAQQQVAAGNDYCNTRTFTAWADGYGEWGKDRSAAGYRFNVGGPALGFEWSNGPFTAGIAGTYAWGKVKGRDVAHERKTRTYAFTAYGQWNYERFYVNAELSYGRNKFKSTRWLVADTGRAKYHSNAWNGQIELGTRLNLCNFLIEPNIGMRYFHDGRKAFSETFAAADAFRYGKRTYHAWEMPVGVNFAYEVGLFNTMLVPRAHVAYVPTFGRRDGKADGYDGTDTIRDRVRRGRSGWEFGLGFQTKLFRSVSAHVDYTLNVRTKAYEHMLNAGIGMTF